MAKDHVEQALNTLLKLMRDDKVPPAARVSAANAILDRGYGKPYQAIHGAGPNGEHLITGVEVTFVRPDTKATDA